MKVVLILHGWLRFQKVVGNSWNLKRDFLKLLDIGVSVHMPVGLKPE